MTMVLVTPHWPKATSSWLLYTFMLWQHVLVLPTRAICPTACWCGNTSVVCAKKELSEIPDGIPEDTQSLVLKDNAFTTIDTTKLVNLTNLERLILDRNQLTSLGPDSLSGLRGLKYLSLEANQISEIANTTFEETPVLKFLYLNNNRMTDITGMVRSLTNLDFLDISFNQIAQIKDFQGLNSLTKLSLIGNLLETVPLSLSNLKNVVMTNNKLTHIPTCAFSSKLQALYLHANHISELAANTFSKLQQLTTLSLGRNAIRTLRRMTFTGLRSLRSLTLDFNPIETIEPQAFKDLTYLTHLDLSHSRRAAESNNIVIDPDVFNDMPKLLQLDLHSSPAIAQKLLVNKTLQKGLGQVQYLYLQNTSLETMPEYFRASFPHIRWLYLSKNPWRCDEDLRVLRNWMQDSLRLFTDKLDVICASPENLKWKAVFTIDIDHFTRGTTAPLTATQGIEGTARNTISSDLTEKPMTTATTTNENISTKLPMDTSTDIPKSRSTNINSKSTTVSVNAIITVDNWQQSTQDNIEEESSQSSNETSHVTSQKPDEQTNEDFDNVYIPIPDVDDSNTDNVTDDLSTINNIIITAVVSVSAVLLIIIIFTVAMLRYRQRKKKMASAKFNFKFRRFGRGKGDDNAIHMDSSDGH